MAIFLDTRGHSTLGIAVCARCGIKFPRDELVDDPNTPGLKVCVEDVDMFDPYRLPPRATESITMEWCRPDLAIGIGHLGLITETGDSFLLFENGVNYFVP